MGLIGLILWFKNSIISPFTLHSSQIPADNILLIECANSKPNCFAKKVTTTFIFTNSRIANFTYICDVRELKHGRGVAGWSEFSTCPPRRCKDHVAASAPTMIICPVRHPNYKNLNRSSKRQFFSDGVTFCGFSWRAISCWRKSSWSNRWTPPWRCNAHPQKSSARLCFHTRTFSYIVTIKKSNMYLFSSLS